MDSAVARAEARMFFSRRERLTMKEMEKNLEQMNESAIQNERKPGRTLPPEAGQLDELDRAILHFLEAHGRATNLEVGEAVGLSASAASRRIMALENRGVIRGYGARIDERLLGRSTTVYVRVTLERQTASCMDAFEMAVRDCRGVAGCHLIAGNCDYLLQMQVADLDDYSQLLQGELARLPGVRRLESCFALRDALAPQAW